MLGIGAIVGTGIFVLTGVAAANYSGPALVISFIIAALAADAPPYVTLNLPQWFPLLAARTPMDMLL